MDVGKGELTRDAGGADLKGQTARGASVDGKVEEEDIVVIARRRTRAYLQDMTVATSHKAISFPVTFIILSIAYRAVGEYLDDSCLHIGAFLCVEICGDIDDVVLIDGDGFFYWTDVFYDQTPYFVKRGR